MRRLIAIALLLGCASMGSPPGGPVDKGPPQLLATRPDTNAVGVTKLGRAEFRFDEVVSERPQGATSLEGLFLVSPRHGEPDVDWKRDAITVRPRRGWRANTVYTVTMLPGLTDLRGNVRREGATLVFSTGAGPLPATSLSGAVFDWVHGAPAPRALVEAISRPDSVVYVTQADSSGRFTLTHLPGGRYTVRGVLDANNNRALDVREAWDSTGVSLADSASAEILAFVHDTIGPGISNVAVNDSVTVRVTFDRPIAVAQAIASGLFVLRTTTPDSTPVPIVAARPASEADRARAEATDSAAPADSARRREARGPAQRAEAAIRGATGDTTPSAPVGKPSRPSPTIDVVLSTQRPLTAGASYKLSAIGIQGLLGATRSSDRVFNVPKVRLPADSAAAAGARPAVAPAARPAVTPPPPPPPTAPATPPAARTAPVSAPRSDTLPAAPPPR